MDCPGTISVVSVAPAVGAAFPAGVLRLDYRSGFDDRDDWALIWPPDDGSDSGAWVVNIHGHGSGGDQLYTRGDIRDNWLPVFRRRGLGILTVNLRGNAWMAPAAASDLHGLLEVLRVQRSARRFIFAGGSMGGTSNLIYAVLHPGDVAAVVTLGQATDLASYHAWCRAAGGALRLEIASAIATAYGASPDEAPQRYTRHSAQVHARRLAMPIFMAHGSADALIGVSQPRRLVAALGDADTLAYVENPGGDHDAPLALMAEGFDWVMTRI